MTRFIRRLITSAVLSVSIVAAAVSVSYGQEKTVRIGFQKYGKLVLLKSKGTLEPRLKALGYHVTWTEFASGPPLLEAVNVGAIDFGNTGETPPVFAQAAGAPIRYVAYEPPAPKGEAIFVAKDSPIKSVADLKGKKVAVARGSNAHYLLVKALEKAGVRYEDITPVFLDGSRWPCGVRQRRRRCMVGVGSLSGGRRILARSADPDRRYGPCSQHPVLSRVAKIPRRRTEGS